MAREEMLLVDDREVVVTDALHVACDGGRGPLGHPVQYMTLEADGEVVCKYCGRRYLHHNNPELPAVRARSRPHAA